MEGFNCIPAKISFITESLLFNLYPMLISSQCSTLVYGSNCKKKDSYTDF